MNLKKKKKLHSSVSTIDFETKSACDSKAFIALDVQCALRCKDSED